MTRYTVSPPMLIEKSERVAPDATKILGGSPSGSDYEVLDELNVEYEQHLSSLQQIRMSEELVKWCEEKGIKEVSSEQIEIREEEDKNNIIDFEGSECYPIYGTVQLAFPVEVVDEWEEIEQIFENVANGDLTHWDAFERLKSKYKLTKL